MTMRKKLLITIACLSVILCSLVTGTIAWLMDKTDPISNKFTPSNITLTLTETPDPSNGKMIPGATLDKKVTVTVKNDIDCYVFVEVVEFNNVDKYIKYAVDGTWNALPNPENRLIYYKKVDAGTSSFDVLGSGSYNTYTWAEDKVLVRPDVTKADMDALNESNAKLPTLSFAAYAIQSEYLAYGDAVTDEARALVAWNTLNAQN